MQPIHKYIKINEYVKNEVHKSDKSDFKHPSSAHFNEVPSVQTTLLVPDNSPNHGRPKAIMIYTEPLTEIEHRTETNTYKMKNKPRIPQPQ